MIVWPQSDTVSPRFGSMAQLARHGRFPWTQRHSPPRCTPVVFRGQRMEIVDFLEEVGRVG